MGQELGQIDINNGSQQQGVFVLFGKSELQEEEEEEDVMRSSRIPELQKDVNLKSVTAT